ncbi:NlpC/P60 family protein [Streptomyces cinereoruber]|uniref:C40 family peptidase n=1 Tax=Streptomyces cinereoruber TaxID=67260 RepID=UPI003C2E3731
MGIGATAAIVVGAYIQAASSDPLLGAALSVAVPAEYRGLVEKAGQTCPEISPNLLAALLQQESGFNPRAHSPADAMGIAQFIPGTWATSGIDGNGDGKRDVWDPEDAIPSAGKHLCDLAQEVEGVPGDKQSNILAAYNAGSGAVRQHGGVPPYKETQDYVRIINANAGPKGGNSGGRTVTATQASAALQAAKRMIGQPYSWGGGNAQGPSTGICCSPNGSSGQSTVGFDCSGLTLYAYAQAGIDLPRTAAQQYAASEPVTGKFHPGDLVFYGSSPSTIHHVAIYAGGGWVIEAPRPGTRVRYSKIGTMPDLFGVARPVSQHSKEI